MASIVRCPNCDEPNDPRYKNCWACDEELAPEEHSCRWCPHAKTGEGMG